MSREELVDRYEDALGSYMIRLHMKPLSEKETKTAARYLSSLTNLERISDHAVNLAELGKELYEKKISFSDEAREELKTCIAATLEILDLTQRAMTTEDVDIAKMVEPLEDAIDIINKTCKANHVRRVQEGNCTLELGFIFNDFLQNMERVADHCSNLAVAVLEANNSSVHSHDYLRSIKESADNQYQILLAGYASKYHID